MGFVLFCFNFFPFCLVIFVDFSSSFLIFSSVIFKLMLIPSSNFQLLYFLILDNVHFSFMISTWFIFFSIFIPLLKSPCVHKLCLFFFFCCKFFNISIIVTLKYLHANSNNCVICGSPFVFWFFWGVFLFIMGHIFLLLSVSGNFYYILDIVNDTLWKL